MTCDKMPARKIDIFNMRIIGYEGYDYVVDPPGSGFARDISDGATQADYSTIYHLVSLSTISKD